MDALKILRQAAALPVAQTQPCPDIGVLVRAESIAARSNPDVDCGGSVSAVDALKLLRFGAELSVGQTAPCPAVGTIVKLYY